MSRSKAGGLRATMVRLLVPVLVGAALVVLPPGAAQARGQVVVPSAGLAVAGEYIVEVRHGAAVDAAGLSATATRLAAAHHGTVRRVFGAAYFGFLAHLDPDDAAALAADPDVKLVQQDRKATLDSVQPNPPSWGLDRIDQRALPLDKSYTAPVGAATTKIYVLDTGVWLDHADFGGRASLGYDVHADDGASGEDCVGHGTHVAGIAAGATYGMAKQAEIVAVRIADCFRVYTAADIVAGLNWVAEHGDPHSVVNLSFSVDYTGSAQSPVDTAALAVVNKGITVVASAGNNSGDACNRSPARVPGVITVAATTSTDQFASSSTTQSNYGSCVDLLAPGELIASAGHKTKVGPVTASGTSQAAPHVAGAAAMLLAMHPRWTPAQVSASLIARATPDVITGVPAGTPNRLLNVGPLAGADGGALPDGDLNTMWNTYGDQGGHWTGGDTTVSVALPDGRIAWLFSDTFLGTVNADHSRPADTPMIHNSIVVQQGNTLKTLTGGTAAHPESLVGPALADAPAGDLGYWAYDGTVEGNKLRVLYNHFTSSGSGALAYRQTGTWLGTFSLPDLTLDSLVDLHVGATVAWGAGILEDGGYTYMYGVEGGAGVKYLHIARAATGTVSGGWTYWTGSSWSTSEAASARVMSGVDGLSVDKINGSYVLISQDADGFFSSDIVAYFGEKPTGPFSDKASLYTAPETAVSGNIIYGAHLHPELGAPGKLVVSYNVNTLLPQGNTDDARIYRPRFIVVTLPAPPDPAALPKPPTRLTAVSDGQGVRLSWTASSTAGVTYRVYQRDLTTEQTQPVRTGPPITGTTTAPGLLTNGHRYEFFVTAVNSGGESPGSNLVTATPQVAAPTAAPTGLTAVAKPDGSAVLSWTGAAGAGWYRVYRKDTTNEETGFTLLPDQVFATTATMRGLSSGHVYQFQVVAVNTGGEGPPSAPASVTAQLAPPPAPTGLTARPNADGTISLSWTSQGPYIWFWVYRRDVTAGESFDHGEYPAVTNTLTAGYLTSGHTYEYKITAINAGGEGPASVTVSAVAKIAVPAAPTNLKAVPGNGEVALSWTAPAPGLWYWVYYQDTTAGDAQPTRAAYPVSTGTSFTAGYLTNGHAYTFSVTAINGGGEGAASNRVTVTPTEPLPAAPTALTAAARGDGTIKLSWTGASPDLWYWIYQRDVTAGEAFAPLAYPLTTGTSFTAGSLKYGHQYQFQVSGINSGGEGPRSATASATSKLDAPTDLTGVATGDGSAQLSWSGPSADTWYWLYYRDVTTGQTFQKAGYPITDTTFTWSATVSGHTYEFKVSAIGAGGEGSASTPVRVTVQGGAPAAPTLSGTAGNGKFTLSWTAPEAGAMYWIYKRCVGCGETRLVPMAYPVSGTTSFVDTAVVNGYAYQYRVSAVNSHGEGAWSNAVSGTPLPPRPAAPGGMTAKTSDMTIVLDWTAPASGLLYWIYSRDVTAGQSDFTRSKYPTDKTTFTVTPLTDGHRYDYYVTAVNVAGESAKSATVSGTPMPGRPTGLTLSNVGGTSVDLKWTAPSPGGVWYWIYKRDVTTGQGFTRLEYPSSTTAFTAQYLHHGHTYEFYVASIRGDGESDGSNTVRVTLQPPDGASTCDNVYSNYLTRPEGLLPAPIPVLGGRVRYEQRSDMLLRACLIYGPTGNTRKVTVKISWNTSNYELNEGFFWYFLVDCTTGQEVKHDNYFTYDRGATSGTREFSYYVDPSHYYRAYATGDGSIQFGPAGTLGVDSKFAGWHPPTGIRKLVPSTNCM
ncbi:fibronectin type III domain-containing protein [Actinoplanes sp. NPDC049599]|uniref:fibronectin type III domain-containing protein n=1 Tax=Actinoplanes sp. NPDC049599 TaxID=3363903 RepID=UPI0037A44629